MKFNYGKNTVLASVLMVSLCLGLTAWANNESVQNEVAVTDSFIVTGARVFDGEQVLAKTNVLVRDGVIVEVGDSAKDNNILNIDGSGYTLIPGLIDGHTHTESVQQLNDALRFGVTTVLDMGTYPEFEQRLREAAKSRVDVADFRSSGLLITATGGHGTEYGYDIPTLDRAEDAEEFVKDRVSGGANYLKLVINGVRHDRSGMPTLDAETVKAVVDAGHARGLLVVAHVESEADVRLAAAAGVDGLVHQWRDAGARPDLAELIAANDMFLVGGDVAVIDGVLNSGPTNLLNDPLISPYLSEAARQNLSREFNTSAELTMLPVTEGLSSLIEANVLLLGGTDAWTKNPRITHGAGMHRLLELMVGAGMSPMHALQAATINIVDVFGLNDRGRITPGLRADMLLVRGDPTENILATRDIVTVWRGGIEVDRQAATSFE